MKLKIAIFITVVILFITMFNFIKLPDKNHDSSEIKIAAAQMLPSFPKVDKQAEEPMPVPEILKEKGVKSVQVKGRVIDAAWASAKPLSESLKETKNKQWVRSRLVRVDSEKYPLIRVDETMKIENGLATIIDRKAMVADHLMVKLKKDSDVNEFEEKLILLGASVRQKMKGSGMILVSFPAERPESLDKFQSAFHKIEAVQLSEKDWLVQAVTLPNDPDLSNCWGLHNEGQSGGLIDADIDAPEAWGLTTGSRQVKVGVIDTGIDYTHPDLAANIWTNVGEIPNNGLDDDNNGYVDDVHGYDFRNNDGDPMDGHSHGTHCAGTIGAVGDDGYGISGVNWNVSMVGIKFLSDSGSGATSDAIESVAYARVIGCDLTSNSWGGGGFSQELMDQIEMSGNAGQLFIAAAGNDYRNDNDTSPHYPSNYELDVVVSVAASDDEDKLANFSNIGATTVDLAAPGVNVYSTVLNGGYASYNGTSMATPHVAGAIALARSLNPTLSPAELKAALLGSVDPINDFDGLMVSGGRLNLETFLVPFAGPLLTIRSYQIIEDGSYGSIGDGDGFVNPGERLAIVIEVENSGQEPILEGSANLRVMGNSQVFLIEDADTYLGDLPSGANAILNLALLDVSDNIQVPHLLEFEVVAAASNNQSWNLPFSFQAVQSSDLTVAVEANTGNVPIASANVWINGVNVGSTDVQGNFEDRLADGAYQVEVTAEGFLSSQQTVMMPSAAPAQFNLFSPTLSHSGNIFQSIDSGSVTVPMQFENTGDGELVLNLSPVGVTPGSTPVLSIQPSSLTLLEGQSTNVDVTITFAAVPTNIYQLGLEVQHNDPKQLTPEIIPVEVYIPPFKKLGLSHSFIDLGTHVYGQAVQAPFGLFNEGSSPLTISSITSTHPDIEVLGNLPFIIAAGQQSEMLVQAASNIVGNYSANLVVVSDDEINPNQSISILAESLPFGSAYDITLSGWPQSVQTASTHPVAMTVIDRFGNRVEDFDDAVELKVLGASQKSLVITEIHPGSPDFIEIQNVGSTSLSVDGYKVILNNSVNSDINEPHTTYWEMSGTMNSGAVDYRTDSSVENYWGSNIWWTHSNPGWAVILDPNDNIVDAVVWGYDEASIESSQIVLNNIKFSLNGSWIGNGIAQDQTSGSMERHGQSDIDTLADWQWGDPNGRGVPNAELSFPFFDSSSGLAHGMVFPEAVSVINGQWYGDLTAHGQGANLIFQMQSSTVTGVSELFDFNPTELEFDKTTVTFQDTYFDQTSYSNLTIFNSSLQIVDILNLDLVGDGVTLDVGSGNFSLQPGETRVIGLSWASSGNIDLDGQLTVYSTDSIAPTRTIFLRGRALSRPIIQTSDTELLIRVQADQLVAKNVNLSNLGNEMLTWEVITSDPSRVTSIQNKLAQYGEEFSTESFEASGNGMDAFGYHWRDSNEVGGPNYEWHDISQTGQLLTQVSNSFGVSEMVTLSFDFPHYGQSYRDVYVCSSGYVSLSNSDVIHRSNPLPSTSSPSNIIGAFIDYLYPGGGGSIYFQDFSSYAVIQFQDVASAFDTGTTVSFQIKLFRNGKVRFEYQSISMTTTECTVGMQNANKDVGFTVVHFAPYLHDELCIEITPPQSWVTFNPEKGNVFPMDENSFDVEVDTTGIELGTYETQLYISSNDPFTPSLVIPLTIEVLPANTAPQVFIQGNTIIDEPGTFSLSANVVDDGLPYPGLLNLTWSSTSSEVLFDDPSSLNPQVTVLIPGTYEIELEVSDGEFVSQESIVVTVLPPPGPKLKSGKVEGVGEDWIYITLPENLYTDPIIVASVVGSNEHNPVVTRIENVSGNGFALKVQNPNGEVLTTYDISYLVAESGSYSESEHGLRLVAQKISGLPLSYKRNWNPSPFGAGEGFQSPAVFTQVMTHRDQDWSAAYSCGQTITSAVSTNFVSIGYHVGEDPDQTRASEDVGVIVLESGLRYSDNVQFEAGLTGRFIYGVGNNGTYDIQHQVTSGLDPVAVVAQSSMYGGDGAWAILAGSDPISNSHISVAVDEDQLTDTERTHTNEHLSYVVFSDGELISTPNLQPIVQASISGNGFPYPFISLDGSASYDPEGVALTYTWLQISGPSAEILYADQAWAYVEPTEAGVYQFKLLISDGILSSETLVSYTLVDENATANIEFIEIDNVSDVWTPVIFDHNYQQAVIIGTVQYKGESRPSAVVRIRNVESDQCDIRVQSPVDALLEDYRVYLMVVEAGVYTYSAHGVEMEALIVNSQQVADHANWIAQDLSLTKSFNDPVVLGQVMSENDPKWSVFWAQGNNRSSIPEAGDIKVGYHVGEDTDPVRAEEQFGVVVVESGFWNQPGLNIEAQVGPQNVKGYGANGTTYNYSGNVITEPDFISLSSAGMQGGNGGWPVLVDKNMLGSGNAIPFELAIDEDTIADNERSHIAESVSFLIMQRTSGNLQD